MPGTGGRVVDLMAGVVDFEQYMGSLADGTMTLNRFCDGTFI